MSYREGNAGMYCPKRYYVIFGSASFCSLLLTSMIMSFREFGVNYLDRFVAFSNGKPLLFIFRPFILYFMMFLTDSPF